MPRMNRILVPVDFSEYSSAALRYALFLASQFGASIDVLHVVELPSFLGGEAAVRPPGGEPRTLAEVARSQAAADLEQLLASVAWRREVPLERRIEIGEPASTIVATAEKHDLVIMGSRGRTGLRHLLMGSIAEKVVRLASCPVLVVRGPVSAMP